MIIVLYVLFKFFIFNCNVIGAELAENYLIKDSELELELRNQHKFVVEK